MVPPLKDTVPPPPLGLQKRVEVASLEPKDSPVDVKVEQSWKWLEETLLAAKRSIATLSQTAADYVKKQDFTRMVTSPPIELIAFDKAFEISADAYKHLCKSVFRFFVQKPGTSGGSCWY